MTSKQEDIIAKVKAEAAAKKSQEPEDSKETKDDEAAKQLDALKQGSDEEKDRAIKAQLAEQAAREAERIMNSDEGHFDEDEEQSALDEIVKAADAGLADPQPVVRSEPPTQFDESKRAAFDAAHKKLRNIAVSYPTTTPNEHVIFGYGQLKFTLGDLRDLFSLPK